MVNGSQPEEPSLIETPASSVVVPTTGRGKLRLSGCLSQLILQAFESPSRKILSLLAIKEFLTQAGYSVNKNSQRLKRELRSLVSHGLLVRVAGSGASASFKLNRSQARGAGKADPGKKKKEVAPKKAAVRKRDPRKNPRKKQPAAAKAKGPQSKASADPGKKQLKRPSAAKKAPRKRT